MVYVKQVEPDDLKGKKLGDFLRQIDKLLNMLRRNKQRKGSQAARS
jgi:hypothetical protein